MSSYTSPEFLPGRLRFDQPEGWVKPVKGDRPPFGCALLIWSDEQVCWSERIVP